MNSDSNVPVSFRIADLYTKINVHDTLQILNDDLKNAKP